MLVKPRLPEPLCFEKGLVVNLRFTLLHLRKILHRQWQGPWRGWPRGWLIVHLVEPHVRHAHVSRFLHRERCARSRAHRSVTRAIHEKLSTKLALTAALYVKRPHRCDLPRGIQLGAVHEVSEKETERLFRPANLLLLVVHEILGASGTVWSTIGEFLDDLSNVRIFAAHRAALRPHANFTAPVAAEDKPILDQGHLKRLPRRGNGRRDPRISAAADHEIKLAGIFRHAARVEPFVARLGECLSLRGRVGGIVGQQDRVTAPVEAGEVVERKRLRALLQFHRTARLPVPVRPDRAELLGQRRAVDHELKAAWCPGRLPRTNPVLGAHPHAILPGL